MTRQKILEMVNRLVVVTTNQQIARPRAPSDMDDEELEAAIGAHIGRLTRDEGPGSAAPAPEGPDGGAPPPAARPPGGAARCLVYEGGYLLLSGLKGCM